jgi:hypothetical protein
MRDLADLLVEISPSIRVGWVLWFSAGLILVAWFRLARATPLPVAVPVAATVVPPVALQKDPLGFGDRAQVPPSAISAVTPSHDERARPTRKSRRVHRAD